MPRKSSRCCINCRATAGAIRLSATRACSVATATSTAPSAKYARRNFFTRTSRTAAGKRRRRFARESFAGKGRKWIWRSMRRRWCRENSDEGLVKDKSGSLPAEGGPRRMAPPFAETAQGRRDDNWLGRVGQGQEAKG